MEDGGGRRKEINPVIKNSFACQVPERIWEHACNPFCLAGLNSGAAELQPLSFVFPAPLPCNGQGLIGTMCEPGESPNPQDFSGNNVLKLLVGDGAGVDGRKKGEH